jgi:monoamine oxidase
MEKIWIKFSEVFWDDTKAYLAFTNEQASGKATVLYNMNFFYRNNPLYNNNNVLLSFIEGSAIEQLMGGTTVGKLTHAQVAVHIADALQVAQVNGKGSVSWSYEMTNFKDDPKFLGSWEYWQLNKTYRDYFDAIAPLNDKLFWAGSAHCNRYWGFTWGAIVSGATTGGWVADKVLGRTAAVPPKSPCNEGAVLTNAEWRVFYQANPFFDRP